MTEPSRALTIQQPMPTRDDILTVLRTIDDPEMPISLVDLGLVESIDVSSTTPNTGADGALSVGASAGARVRIDLLPTFVGCHALPMMERQVRERVGALTDVVSVEVRFLHDPPWSVDRITDAGREALRRFGVTVPTRCSVATSVAEAGPGAATAAPNAPPIALATPRPTACPYCNSPDVQLENAFGPTRCRTIYYCSACRNAFEHLKRV